MPELERVVVLAGGLSHERDVSLRSGRRVAEAVADVGIEVEVRDVDPSLLTTLTDDPPSCVWPLLHGEAGEDGAVAELLELLGVPYVGSAPWACRLAFDKPVAKSVVAAADVPSPPGVVLPHETFRELGARAVMAALVDRVGLPLFVKPTRGGSALGCSRVDRVDALPGAMVTCFAHGPVALVERFVPGTEVAVGVVDTGAGPEALPAVGIYPDGGHYDYAARYTAGTTEFVVPPDLPADVAARCAGMATAAHRALGLRDLSRSDLIVDPEGTVWWLEANVAPGMTETSLVPLALSTAGRDLGELGRTLLTVASRRRLR